MTYFGFLGLFLGLPLAILGLLTYRDLHHGRGLPWTLRHGSPWVVLLLHVVIALVYTTPWDNYLVATGVWYYNPSLVTGVRLGWVPIEEYTFFVLQPLLSGLWLLFLARRIPYPLKVLTPPYKPPRTVIWLLGLLWLCAFSALLLGWDPAIYLSLILVWALPPILLQLAFGGDLLWQQRRLVLTTLLSATLYLSAADSLAIGSGTWTIAPDQSLNIFLGDLPLEEFVFFLVTNTLIVFGIVLALSRESRTRFETILRKHPWTRNLVSPLLQLNEEQ